MRAWKAADHINNDRVLRHALAEGVKVLLTEHGGGHKNGDLFACKYSLECRANGDLCLAEPDVATDQTIHRLPALHVLLAGLDRTQLVGRLFEGKGGLEVFLPRVIGWEGETASFGATCVELEHLSGVVKGSVRRLHGSIPRRRRPCQALAATCSADIASE